MNSSEFTYLIQNPQNLNKDQVKSLGQVVDKHPYFQSARALYLKGLKSIESTRYNGQLKKTAAYTTDRSILFDFITSDVFNQNNISQMIKQNSESIKDINVVEVEDISVNKSVTIDDALNEYIKNTEGVLDPELFEQKIKPSDLAQLNIEKPKLEQAILEVDTKHIEKTPEETLQIGKPLEFNKNEKHSFAEWLKITNFKPIDRSEEATQEPNSEKKEHRPSKTDSSIEKKYEIIDRFLNANPKIIPTKEAHKKEVIIPDTMKYEGLMTETLARIYLEQKNYEKAIQSYKILSLKYPEKSGFFADQIKAVKKLQESNS